MVVYAVWDRVARVRFPAPRQYASRPNSLLFGRFAFFDLDQRARRFFEKRHTT